MGNTCNGRQKAKLEEELALNRSINEQLREDMQASDLIVKLLLLGSGESGKSTIYKQLTLIHGSGFSVEMRTGYRDIIVTNVIANMKVLCLQLDNPEWGGGNLPDDLKKSKAFIVEMDASKGIDENVARDIRALWRHPTIQSTYSHRARYQLSDNCKYFCDKVEEIAKKDFIPSEEDIVRARVRTTGIVSCQFPIEGTEFELYDVGGQRNERRKWIHVFDNVTAVLYVSALSAYDQVLYEDNKTNRVHESLNLFEQVTNNRYFCDTPIILFLNKSDLFREKLPSSPLTKAFPQYKGPLEDFEAACAFVENEFLKKNKNSRRTIYTHVTTATNTENIATVFQAVRSIILQAGLQDSALHE